jgi:hypothetical protein
MTNEEFKRWTRWDEALGCHMLPLSPTTLSDDDGLPVGRSWWDHDARRHQFAFNEPSEVGNATTGWDDDHLCWRELTVTWDGAVPELVRFGTPGHSRGLLLEFYPRLGDIREYPLVTKLVPRGRQPVWLMMEDFNPTKEASL